MGKAVVAGVGMTRFGKHLETGLKALGREALLAALADAGVEKEAIEAAFVGNAMAGLVTGQECIRGQVVLRSAGIGAIPVINVENACAGGATASSRNVNGFEEDSVSTPSESDATTLHSKSPVSPIDSIGV